MSSANTSIDGNCPFCKGRNWKTLKALALTQHARTTSITTGPRQIQRRETTGQLATELVLRHAQPLRPDDYAQKSSYRQRCDELMATAQGKLEEIDAACKDPLKALPGFFKHGPETEGSSFEFYAERLEQFVRYEKDLARWEATKICLRCAATFIDEGVRMPFASPLLFSFAGQERRCTECSSYFWKDPGSVADHREKRARGELASAQKALLDAHAAEKRAAAESRQNGAVKNWLVALFAFGEVSVAEAQTAVTKAELKYSKTMRAVVALRDRCSSNTRMRWCVKCESTYVCPAR